MLPSSGRLRTARDGDPRQGVDRGQRVGAGVLDGPGDRPDVGDVRRELHEQRQVGGSPDGGRDRAGGLRVDRELEAALADVRAADVQLDAGDARDAVEPPRDLDVVVDRLAGDVDDDRHPPARQVGAYFSMTASTPGFWRPIEFSIPPGVSVTRGRGVADPRLQRRALAADRAEPLDVDDVAVLDAVAERPRRDEDRVRQDEARPSSTARSTGSTASGAGSDDRSRPPRSPDGATVGRAAFAGPSPGAPTGPPRSDAVARRVAWALAATTTRRSP